MAYLLAQCAPPLKLPDKQPTAYSYNGVVLPKLPEWDKTVYPYAVITKTSSGYALFVCQQEPAPRPAISSDPSYIWFGEYDYKPMKTNCYEPYSEWEDITASSIYCSKNIFWTDTDIYNTDGTVYLAASSPIPVYE